MALLTMDFLRKIIENLLVRLNIVEPTFLDQGRQNWLFRLAKRVPLRRWQPEVLVIAIIVVADITPVLRLRNGDRDIFVGPLVKRCETQFSELQNWMIFLKACQPLFGDDVSTILMSKATFLCETFGFAFVWLSWVSLSKAPLIFISHVGPSSEIDPLNWRAPLAMSGASRLVVANAWAIEHFCGQPTYTLR